tara:strand:- start:721 stop:1695 length:975 start_codon:yes stop_codon:yes gene_type:complete
MSFNPETLSGLTNVNDDVFFNQDVTFYGKVNLDDVSITGNTVKFSKDIKFTGGDITVKRLNATDIITQTINAGISTFQDIYINGKLYDGNGDFGSSGQVLSSDGSHLDWINTSDANVGSASNVGTNENATDADQYVTFVAAKTGNNPIRVDEGIKYNPSTNVLTVGSLSLSGASSGGVVPSGAIILWSGAANQVPSGWHLCDGQNSTPDLRNRFVVGASLSGGYAVDATGGSADAILVEHSHGAGTYTADTDGNHNHNYDHNQSSTSLDNDESNQTIYPNQSQDTTSSNGDHTHTISGISGSAGQSGTNANLPPYYALCYIMKS